MTGEPCRVSWTTKVFLYNFDINEGYHHIDIDENDQKYLGFQKERENMCALKNSVNTK